MEINHNKSIEPALSQEQMIKEIYEGMKKTQKYMKWQLYITLVLVVLPLLALLVILPFVLKTLAVANIPSIQGLQ
jgi:hypothetical protein